MCAMLLKGLNVSDVQKRVNRRHSELFIAGEDNGWTGLVCTFCDHCLVNSGDRHVMGLRTLDNEVVRNMFSWSREPDVASIKDIVDYYKLKGNLELLGESKSKVLELCLSPRGRLLYNKNNGQWGYSCCMECKSSIEKKKLPTWAIINKNFIGCAPSCLSELSEVELAMVTPISKHGYTFTYTGGQMYSLKGSCTLMRLEKRVPGRMPAALGQIEVMRASEEKIVEVACQLEGMGLTEHVLILITGKLTEWQLKRAEEKATIRTEKVIKAVKWLCENNPRWEHVNLEEIKSEANCEKHEYP